MSLSRRHALHLLFGSVAIGLASACSALPSSPPATAPTAPTAPPPAATITTTSAGAGSSSTPAAAGAPQQALSGGTLRIVTSTDLAYLEGHRLMGQNWDMLYQVFDRLTEYDEHLQPQPRLAESWDFSSDAKQLKFNLRKGIQFHSGRELTSDDVKYNILRARDPKTGASQMVTMGGWWSGIETPDKYTIILTSDQPRPAAFDFTEYLNIIDKDVAEGPEAATSIAGTGPFKFVDWVQGDHLTFTKNPNYWQSGKPYLDGIEFRVIPDQQAVVNQLEAGAADAIDNPPVRDAARLRQDTHYQVITNQFTGGYLSVLVNTSFPPFDQKEVRQALSYALDRKRFVDTVMLGAGTPEDLVWPTSSPAYEPDKIDRFAFDLDKARSLLQQAGVSGASFEFMFNSVNSAHAVLAQLFQSDLQQIGLNATLRPVEAAAWSANTPKAQYNGLNVGPGGFAQVQPTTFFLFSVYWALNNNAEAFDSDEYRRLLGAASSEPDAAKRKALYSQINDFILDQAFVLMVGSNPEQFACRTNVHGVRYNLHQGIVHTDIWMS